MAFCPNCGAEVQGRYCAKCGTAIDVKADPVSPPAVAPQPLSAPGMSENMAAGLCYLLGLVTGIIFLVLEPYNKNKLVRFHAFQSIFLNVAAIVVFIALGFILPWELYALIWLLRLACWGLFIFMLIQTYQGKKIVLPVIGELAAKQA